MRLRATAAFRTAAGVCLIALLASVPAFAAPVGDTSPATVPTSTPTATPAPPRTPATPPAGSPAPSSPTGPKASKPATSGDSQIPVPVDPETQRFRDELAKRQARLEEFKSQLDELDRELAIATEAYNEAKMRLDETKRRLDVTEEDLRNAERAYREQVDLLRERAEAMYRDGDLGVLDVLFGAKSIPDFFRRLQFLGIMSERDAEVAASLAAQRDRLQQTNVDLEQAEAQAEALEFDLKARKIEIELRVQERQEMLASAQSDLLSMLDEEYARRMAEEAALMQAILSGAGKAGIIVAPGSPVETALAYHGVPYLWGGETPAGFDCSGLVLYVYRQHGVELPHYSGSQFLLGSKVEPSDLRPGDVVFFGSPIHHVGIYMGAGYYIHAPKTGDFVKVSRLADRSDYAGARRYDWVPRTNPIVGLDQLSPQVNHANGVPLHDAAR